MTFDPTAQFVYDPNLNYYLCRVHSITHKPISIIRPLSGEETNTIINYIPKVYSWILYKEKIVEMEMQFADYLSFESQQYNHPVTSAPAPTKILADRYRLVNVNRLLKNYIFTWRSCIELMERDVKKYHGGEDSTQFKDFKKEIAHLFDDNFEYRFFIRLRNVAAHLENIIQTIHYYKGQTIPMFSKQILLDTNVFTKHFRADFDKYAAVFPVKPILEKSFELIKELVKYTMEIHKSLFITGATNLNDIARGIDIEDIGFSVQVGDRLHSQEFPKWIYREILSYYSS